MGSSQIKSFQTWRQSQNDIFWRPILYLRKIRNSQRKIPNIQHIYTISENRTKTDSFSWSIRLSRIASYSIDRELVRTICFRSAITWTPCGIHRCHSDRMSYNTTLTRNRKHCERNKTASSKPRLDPAFVSLMDFPVRAFCVIVVVSLVGVLVVAEGSVAKSTLSTICIMPCVVRILLRTIRPRTRPHVTKTSEKTNKRIYTK